MIDPEAIRDSVQYTRREVAELLGCSINTVRNRVSAGLIRAHRDEINARQRARHRESPESARDANKKYYAKNKEKIAARHKEYQALHLEELRAKARDYYRRNREKIAAQRREKYRQRKKEQRPEKKLHINENADGERLQTGGSRGEQHPAY